MNCSAAMDRALAPGADLPEARRNRLLRRVDWRFLLPNPAPSRTLCFPAGDLRAALELVSGSVCDAAAAVADGCDLAVAVDPDQAQLHHAWRALAPGGACYTEWHSLRFGHPTVIRRQLESIGFRDVTCYLPWRSPPRTELWLPLGSKSALHHFVRRPLPVRRAVRRLLHAWRRRLLRGCLRVGALRPTCAVAIKPSPPRGRSLPSAFPAGFLHGLAARSPDRSGSPPEAFTWTLLTGGHRSISKVVGVALSEPTSWPRMVVKMTRVHEAIPGLAREASTLRALETWRDGGVPGAPRLLFSETGPYGLAIGETAVAGTPIAALLRRDNYARLADQATGWSIALASFRPPSPAGSPCARVIAQALEQFEGCFGPVLDPAMLRDARGVLAGLRDLPAVCEHRDFAPWNVLLAPDGRLGVLDWESSELEGIPALDVLYMLTYLDFYLHDAMRARRWLDSYHRTLDPSTFTGRVRRRCLARYCAAVGLDPGLLFPLSVLVWTIHARSEHRRLMADSGAAPDTDALRRSVFVRLWEAELRRGPR